MRFRRIATVAILALTAIAVFVAAPNLAGGDNGARQFRARLNGFSEVPSISTLATGKFHATVNSAGTEIQYELSYSGLEGAGTVVAHIHLGQKDVNGGVVAFLCGGGGEVGCPAGSGVVTGTIVASEVSLPGQGIATGEIAELIKAMRAGVTYVNVHTLTTFPGGEIRGQVRPGGDD